MPAPDGATALRLAGDDIDAVVLDVGLPDADGRDVCQAMRANGFVAPVVFLTAHHQLTDRLSAGSPPGATTTCPSRSTSPNSPPDCGPPSNAGPHPRPRPPPETWSWTRSATACQRARRPVDLTPTEFRLLAALMAGSGGGRAPTRAGPGRLARGRPGQRQHPRPVSEPAAPQAPGGGQRPDDQPPPAGSGTGCHDHSNRRPASPAAACCRPAPCAAGCRWWRSPPPRS